MAGVVKDNKVSVKFDTYCTTIGQRIRHHREKQKLSLSELGELIGVHKANLNKIEQGKNITLRTLFNISQALNVPISKLLEK